MILNQIQNQVREILHNTLVRLVHATSAQPLTIQAVPVVIEWPALRDGLMLGDELERNKNGAKNSTKSSSISLLLENVYQDSIKAGAFATEAAGLLSRFSLNHKLVRDLNLARQVVLHLAAWDLVGVQPMTGPVCYAHTMRVPGPLNDQEKGLRITKEIVEAKRTAVNAVWARETTDAVRTLANICMEEEMQAAMAWQIITELDQHLIHTLKNLAKKNTLEVEIDPENPAGSGQALAECIVKATLDRNHGRMRHRELQKNGNWCVVSPGAFGMISAAKDALEWEPVSTELDLRQKGNLRFVGRLNNLISVYVDQSAREGDPILVGYVMGQLDSGLIFSPYVPLTSTIAIDPDTLVQTQKLATRNGMWIGTEYPDQQFVSGSDYYSLVQLRSRSGHQDSTEPTAISPSHN